MQNSVSPVASDAHSHATLEHRIELALDSIRGYIQQDGGDIRVANIIGDVVEIQLLGACTNCSMSDMTMKAGVEQAILRAVPEIKEVRTVAQ